MSLTLYFHPLSSYCHKVLIALHENRTPFTPHLVDLMDPEANAAFKKIWPLGKFPVLRDGDRIVPESTSIIEYLAQRYPGPTKLIPDLADAAFAIRAIDRFYDLHIHTPMQKIIGDRLRPADQKDTTGVEQALSALHTALGMIEKELATRTWAAGAEFTMADCAAAPPLFYLDRAINALAGTYDNVAAYLDRVKQRPAYARVLKEAEPYLHLVPA